MAIIKFPFKVIAAVLVFILTIIVSLFKFLFCYAVVVLNIISAICVIIGVVLMIMDDSIRNGAIIVFIAFLISPLGIPRIVDWLIDKLDDLNEFLKDFLRS